MVMQVDATDRALLEVLQRDGRLSMRELAVQLHISRANAYSRVKRLREIGAIRAFVADVDPEALGLDLPAYIYLRIQQHSWKAFRDRVLALPEAMHLALVSGEYDCVLLVRTRNVRHLRMLVLEVLQSMPEVLATQTVFILDEAAPSPVVS